MKYFGLLWERVALVFVAIFAFALLLLSLFLPTAFFDVQANEKPYLQVKSSDFRVVESYKQTSKYYHIVLEYRGDENLPHNVESFDTYALEVNGTKFCIYEQNDALINLNFVSHYGSPKLIDFCLKTTGSGEKVGYTNEINLLRIEEKAKLGAQDSTNYLGIEFTDGLTLVKDDGAWSVQATQDEEEKYEVELNATNAGLCWNTDSALLEATLALPFTRDTDVSYACTLDVRLNNMLETVRAVQYAGEPKLRLLFENYVTPLDNEIPCIRIQSGQLTDATGGTVVSVSGEISFYEYVDKTWATEKYVQLKETVLGETTERKLGVADTYVFARPQVATNKIYAGWTFQGELTQVGETVEMASYTKRTIETEAVLLGYGSITGASIRYDQTGDCSGIRFGAKLFMEDFGAFEEHIQGVGIIVMPGDLLGTEEFTLANYGAAGQAKNFFVSAAEIASDNEYFTFYAVIAKVLQSNYNRVLFARAYVLMENGEYIWTTNVEYRSVYEVATAIMDEYKEKANLETWQTTIVETYLNGVANVTYEDGMTKVLSSALSPVITAAEAEETGNYVTIKLTTQKTSFAAITYNGKRVKNATQSYSDGILTITFDKTQAKA